MDLMGLLLATPTTLIISNLRDMQAQWLAERRLKTICWFSISPTMLYGWRAARIWMPLGLPVFRRITAIGIRLGRPTKTWTDTVLYCSIPNGLSKH